MGEPPVEVGGNHETVTWLLAFLSVIPLGAAGIDDRWSRSFASGYSVDLESVNWKLEDLPSPLDTDASVELGRTPNPKHKTARTSRNFNTKSVAWAFDAILELFTASLCINFDMLAPQKAAALHL
jgi:hypothetical protein